MTLLVDWEIDAARMNEQVSIEPFKAENLGPNSYDITLGSSFVKFTGHEILGQGMYSPFENYDPRVKNKKYFERCDDDECVIQPGQLILGSTVEYFRIKPGIVAFVHGRSSWARIGLQIHAAGLLDSGWEGNITLEIVNFAPFPIILRKDDKIGQVTFERIHDCEIPYNIRKKSKYDKQSGATESRMYVDYEE